MIATLLMFLLFAVLQVAAYFYLRNIVQSSAAAGARYGASEGVSSGRGASRATVLVAAGSSGGVAHDVPCRGATGRDAGGLPVAIVRCSGHIRSIFLPIG